MAITFVGANSFTAQDGGTTNVQATLPPSLTAGDLIIAVYSNVGNDPAQGPRLTPASGWIVQNEVTDGTNNYCVVLWREADSTDVANAGTTVSIGTLNSTGGSTYRVTVSSAYRSSAGQDVRLVTSNLNHVSNPTGSTVSTGTVTNNDSSNWYVCAFNSASPANTAGSWTSTASTKRDDDGFGDASFAVSASIWDSNGAIATGSHSYNGTWSNTPTRLNGWIGILQEVNVASESKYFASSRTGSVATPANAVGAPNGTFTTDSGNTNWTHSWTLEQPTPTGTDLFGPQQFTFRVRQDSAGGNNPTINSATLHVKTGASTWTPHSLLGSTTVTSATGQDFTGSVDASVFASAVSMNDHYIEIATTGSGGSPSSRRSVQIDAVTWNVQYDTGAPPGTTLTPSDAETLNDTSAKTFTLLRSDNVELSDSVSITASSTLDKSDEVSLADSVSAGLLTTYNASDTVELSDFSTRTASLEKSDAVQLADTTEVNHSFTVSVADDTVLSDQTNSTATIALEDSCTLSDALTPEQSSTRTDSDTVELFDAFNTSVEVSIEHVLNLSDTVDTTSAYTRTTDDATELSDTVAVSLNLLREDGLDLNDTTEESLSNSQLYSEEVEMSDSLLFNVTQLHSDTTTLLDNSFSELVKNFVDDVVLSEGFTPSTDHVVSTSDVITLSDTASTSETEATVASDVVGLSDVLSYSLVTYATDLVDIVDEVSTVYTHVVSDNVVLADQNAIEQTLVLDVADELTTDDTTLSEISYVVDYSNNMELVDTTDIEPTLVLNVEDSLDSSDLVSSIADYLRSASDDVLLEDFASVDLQPAGIITDHLSLDDTLYTAIERIHSQSNEISLSDDSSAELHLVVNLSDSCVLSDGSSFEYSVQADDIMELSDTSDRVTGLRYSASDAVNLSDDTAKEPVHNPIDTSSLDDSSVSTWEIVRVFQDEENLSDTAFSTIGQLISAEDILGLSDVASLELFLTLSDTSNLSDTAQSTGEFSRDFSDFETVSDEIHTGTDNAKDQSDVLSLNDTCFVILERTVSDAIDASDGVDTDERYTKSDIIGLTDNLSFSLVRVFQDTLSLSDITSSTIPYIFVAQDSVSLSDVESHATQDVSIHYDMVVSDYHLKWDTSLVGLVSMGEEITNKFRLDYTPPWSLVISRPETKWDVDLLPYTLPLE